MTKENIMVRSLVVSNARTLCLGAASLLLVSLATGIPTASAAGAVPVGPNLVTNGNFEATPAPGTRVLNGGTWGWYTALPGWSVCQNNLIEWGSNWLGSAHSGTHYVELNSNVPSAICQTIPTTPGQTYQLSLWFSARPGTPASANQMTVKWGGTNLTSTPISADGTHLTNTSWTHYAYTVTATASSTTIQFTDVGTANVPHCGGCGSLLDDVGVQQLDTPPTVTSVTVPTNATRVNTPVTVSVTFTDPDVADSHTVTWSWGDGKSSTTAVTREPSGSTPGTATASHVYTSAGIYRVTVTVTDKFGYSGSLSASIDTVIYNPSAGFVTGGGWAMLPAGGSRARGNFGFVSKYQGSATMPAGQTEFQLNAADIRFHSSGYDWLVITGDQARFKGEGTINGRGRYSFQVTALDAERSGGALSADTFRITIWNTATGATVYDSGAPAALGGGNIVIHTS